jgi:hypothetical protein
LFFPKDVSILIQMELERSSDPLPGSHSTLKIDDPRIPHAYEFFGSNVAHGPCHAVDDDFGIPIRGELVCVLIHGIKRDQEIGSFNFALIGDMNVDEREILAVHHLDELIDINVSVRSFVQGPGCRREMPEQCNGSHDYEKVSPSARLAHLFPPPLVYDQCLPPSLQYPV